MDTGLSPRVRGNLQHQVLVAEWCGSIPARAGEPSIRAHPGVYGWVYPRACGGTSHPHGRRGIDTGLSPRVRGNPVGERTQYVVGGSIPARAGEPPTSAPAAAPSRVYPRACGGTVDGDPRPVARSGLSPRVRGNRPWVPKCRVSRRSIPARAGEPVRVLKITKCSGVYPRACGGTIRTAAALATGQGLSPRVRGNRTTERLRAGQMGSIPARAGEPTGAARSHAAGRVYPRACGGTSSRSVPPRRFLGLSPRVRGNH